MTEIKPGDEVRVFYTRPSLRRQYPDGFPGTVTKAGKRYASAVFSEPWTDPSSGGQKTREHEIRFDMETGHESPGIFGLLVRTPAQLDADARRKEAVAHLGLAGLEFKIGRERFLTLAQLEALAEVVKTWDLGD